MRVLDTAALLNWPLSELSGIVSHLQREEALRLAPELEMIFEAAELEWRTPSQDSLTRARTTATETGDIAGLSAVDLELLALAIEFDCLLVSDDYRLQNCCSHAGLAHQPVTTDGISEQWRWQLVCPACGAQSEAQQPSARKNDYGECSKCGANLSLRKIK